MVRRTSVIAVLLLIFVAATVSISVAQKRAPTVLKGTEGEGIDRGTVVAFGKVINPPYSVSYENGKVLINGIVFSPREPDPSIETKTVAVSEMQLKRYNFIKSVSEAYVDERMKLGESEARRQVVDNFKLDPILRAISFDDDYLVLEFTDGHVEWLDVDSYVEKSEGLAPTEEEKSALRAKRVSELTDLLQKDGVVAFGYSYTIMTDRPTFTEAQRIVRMAKAGQYSMDKATDELVATLGPQGRDLFEDVKNDLAQW